MRGLLVVRAGTMRSDVPTLIGPGWSEEWRKYTPPAGLLRALTFVKEGIRIAT